MIMRTEIIGIIEMSSPDGPGQREGLMEQHTLAK
jgi:hypothetical protein